MLATALLLLLVQLSPCIISSSLKKVICVIEHNYSNDEGLQHNCTSVRNNLSSAIQEVNDDTVLLLFNKQETLESSIQFINVSGLTLSGTNKTIIVCSQKVVKHGLKFVNVTDLKIHGLSIINCGALYQRKSSVYSRIFNYNFSTAVYVIHCTNLDIRNTIISKSHGTGLTLYSCSGNVSIIHSNFANNTAGTVNQELSGQLYGGGGIYFEMTLQRNNGNSHGLHLYKHSTLYVYNCTFRFNSVAQKTNNFQSSMYPSGGLIIWLSGFANNNTVTIESTYFISNSGVFGGGLFIVCREGASNNSVIVKKSVFLNNKAILGGGGMDIGFSFKLPKVCSFNSIIVQSCNITGNKAYFGGGVVFFVTSASQIDPNNHMKFYDTVWKFNEATYGSAIYLEPIFNDKPANTIFPVPHLVNCNFRNNFITFSKTGNSSSSSGVSISALGSGAMNSKAISFTLSGLITFSWNNGTALYLIDSNAIVLENTSVIFSNNAGTYGGAVSINGFASVYTSTNTNFTFLDNVASVKGGAIYSYSTDIESSLLIGASCFVERTRASKAINFYFKNNSDSFGKSVYVSSLLPCNKLCQGSKVYLTYIPPQQLLTKECVGNFTFADHNGTVQNNIATETSEFDPLGRKVPKEVVPGKDFLIPFVTRDELGHESIEPLFGTLTTASDSLHLHNIYTANNRFQIRGQPNDTGHLKIGTLYFRNLTVGIDVTLSACPPGFININNTCICSQTTDHDSDHYYGIIRCDNKEFVASLTSGFWIGYVDIVSEDTLYTGLCPQGYCKNSQTLNVKLPSIPSFNELDSLICGSKNRTGILCGDCIENNSVYYNAPGYKCGNNDNCSYGPLYYLLSSIIPLTLMFTVIIMLGVNFSSGRWNGFVFFAQIVGYFTATTNGVLYVSSSERIFHIISVLFYGPFSLRFFNDDDLSFCIFKGANFFAIMGIEIFSLFFAFFLVVILVFVMKSNYFYRMQSACCKRPFFKPTTLTKALTTFLILCYSQTTQICFKSLQIGFLTRKGEHIVYPLRVQQMGSQEYFTGVHIPFVLAAMIGILTIVTITPLCLMAYPVFYRVFPHKNRITVLLIRKVEALKPIFDAFQGCFNDKYRFFAGLYFLYRVIFVSVFSLINVPLASLFTQVVVTTMLAVHLKIQPYKKKLHNNVDGCLFSLLGIINTLTLARYVVSDSYSHHIHNATKILGYIQLFFVHLPIIILICLPISFILKKCRMCCRSKRQKDFNVLNDSLDLQSYHETTMATTNYYEMDMTLSLDSADGSKFRKELEDLELGTL